MYVGNQCFTMCSLQDNADTAEVITFFETYYSHIFYIVYDAFITAEINLRQRGAHKAQREELESVLYLFEKVRKKNVGRPSVVRSSIGN